MKLVRLVSTPQKNGTLLFDCNFNDGIEINADSKIALQSVSANLTGGNFIITDANNDITYQIKTGFEKTINLQNNIYTKSNFTQLLYDIENKLNESTKWELGLNKVLGLEWHCSLEGAGKIYIQYKIGASREYNDPTGAGGQLWLFNNVKALNTSDPHTGLGVYALEVGLPASGTFDNLMISNSFVSKGVGYVRARIATLTTTGDANSSGYYVGLSKLTGDGNYTEHDLSYAIRATITPLGVLEYYTVIDGVATLSATSPTAVIPNSDDNDVMEVVIDGRLVKMNIFRSDGTKVELILGGLPYTAGENLYPFIVFKSDSVNGSVDGVRFTPSQFNNEDGNLSTDLQPQQGLSAPPVNTNPIRNTDNYIRFQSINLANYLGYASRRQPQGGYQNSKLALFIGQEEFSVGLSVRGFIIELLNMKLDCYDSYSNTPELPAGGQRANILAVIPSTDSSGNLVFTPPTLNFIDLLNKQPLSVRNIKARIVSSDYSELEIEGLGMINLLLD